MRLSLLGKIIDLIAPRQCAICHNRLLGEEEILCTSCIIHLPRTETWKNPYENEMAKLLWKQIPIERCCALLYYKSQSYVSDLIYQLKYAHRPEIGVYLGKLLAQQGLRTGFFEGIDGIIPVPLTPKREHERGYNQSERIAEGIHQLTQLPVIKDVVGRNIFRGSQTHKTHWERNENVENAFYTQNPEHLQGSHFLIVDDVMTTGSTIIACAQELMKAKALKFSVLTVGFAGEYT